MALGLRRRGLGGTRRVRRTPANLSRVLKVPGERAAQLPPAHGRDRGRCSSARCCSPCPARRSTGAPTLGPRSAGRPRGRPARPCRRGASTITATEMQTAQSIMTNRVNKHRRRVAERRHPGRQRDRHPARRRPRPGEGGEDHRHRPASCSSSTSRLTSRRRRSAREPAGAGAVALQPPHARCRPRRSKGDAARRYYLFKRTKTVTTKVKGKNDKKTTTTHKMVQGPDLHAEAAPAAVQGGKQPANTQVLGVPRGGRPSPARGRATASAPGRTAPRRDGTYWYLFNYHPGAPNGPPELTGKELVESDISADLEPADRRARSCS